MQLFSLVLTLAALGIYGKNFTALMFTWQSRVDALAAEEAAWFYSVIMYGIAGLCFTIALLIGWCTDSLTYGELALLAFFVCVAQFCLAVWVPAFNFRSREPMQHDAG